MFNWNSVTRMNLVIKLSLLELWLIRRWWHICHWKVWQVYFLWRRRDFFCPVVFGLTGNNGKLTHLLMLTPIGEGVLGVNLRNSTECAVEMLDVFMAHFLVVPWWMMFRKIINKVEFSWHPYYIKPFWQTTRIVYGKWVLYDWTRLRIGLDSISLESLKNRETMLFWMKTVLRENHV